MAFVKFEMAPSKSPESMLRRPRREYSVCQGLGAVQMEIKGEGERKRCSSGAILSFSWCPCKNKSAIGLLFAPASVPGCSPRKDNERG